MKLTASLAVAASIVAATSAQTIQINNPTEGTVWNVGEKNFVGWTNNCASMGNASTAVKIELVEGPASAVRFVTDVGVLDCSGSNTRADATVPDTIKTGMYSIRVLTLPQNSYSPAFQVNNPKSQPPATTGGPTPTPSTPTGAGNLLTASGSLTALLGCAAAVLQYVV
ncbi:hypothetical protein BGZ75_003489 [Mortierella antarctica]|uniref:Uncharacterized protein n=1 Tax=Mortierella alpina TaxID=64518 RepID=A0A9P7ZYE4_MORAP|nr:hypothetical protein BGZ67_004489 [Mortierella alpina]KAF9990162.1 hypothetical protein BGZ75_003489 [Mortierella antarctica]KAG9319455.1 hypothetical protein KVV02_001958 [Mortierella alpina]